MSRYRFVEAESRRYSVTQLCRIAQVSRTAYYEWQDGEPSQRTRDDAALTAKIRAIHAASDGQYGVPRVLAELRAQGQDVGRKRVARLMKAAGLRGRRPPRWVRTTTPEAATKVRSSTASLSPFWKRMGWSGVRMALRRSNRRSVARRLMNSCSLSCKTEPASLVWARTA